MTKINRPRCGKRGVPPHGQLGASLWTRKQVLTEPFQIEITPQELGTILAALRLYQDGWSLGIQEIATNGGAYEALNRREIDLLCERINTHGGSDYET